MLRSRGVKIAVTYLFAITAVSAVALPSAWKEFSSKYSIQAGSNLGKAKCLTCHTNMKGKVLNSYGKQIDSILKPEGRKKVTGADLHAVEGKDASGTGQSNISRIHADKLPGG